MTPLLALLLLQSPATAAEFFPLTPGIRRTYEEKGEATSTIVEEIGSQPALFDGAPATPIVQKSRYNQTLGTTYYRIDGPTVLTVGYAEDRSAATPYVGDADAVAARTAKRHVLLQLIPAMPVFRYEGKETAWAYGEVPVIRAAGETGIRTDETAIKGTAKPIGIRTVLDRKVDAIEVRSEVQIGSGKLAQTIVETSIYGRGVGLMEAVRKTTSDGRSKETRTRLVEFTEKAP